MALDTAAVLAKITETLTRPRFHTHCGETHAPGPCNDGVTRPTPPAACARHHCWTRPHTEADHETTGPA